MMKIWLCNLGKYNEGTLVGKWVDLPVDDFKPILDEIGINKEYEEYFIADYECDFYKVHEYDNIYFLNYATKLVQDYCMGNTDKIAEINVAQMHTSPSNLVELINLILQLDDLGFIHLPNEGDTDYEIGEHFAEIDGVYQYLSERNLECYFDYAKYGHTIAFDYTIDDGVMLHNNERIDLDYYSYDEIKEMMEE